jgi:hypothetical protein
VGVASVRIHSNNLVLVSSGSFRFHRADGATLEIGGLKVRFTLEPFTQEDFHGELTVDSENLVITHHFSGNPPEYPHCHRTLGNSEVGSIDGRTYFLGFSISRCSVHSEHVHLDYSVLTDGMVPDESCDAREAFLEELEEHFEKIAHWVEPLQSCLRKRWNPRLRIDPLDELDRAMVLGEASRKIGEFDIALSLVIPQRTIAQISGSHDFHALTIHDDAEGNNPATETTFVYEIQRDDSFDDVLRLMEEDLAWVWFKPEA